MCHTTVLLTVRGKAQSWKCRGSRALPESTQHKVTHPPCYGAGAVSLPWLLTIQTCFETDLQNSNLTLHTTQCAIRSKSKCCKPVVHMPPHSFLCWALRSILVFPNNVICIWSDHHVVLCGLMECTMTWVWFSFQINVICTTWLQLILFTTNEGMPLHHL